MSGLGLLDTAARIGDRAGREARRDGDLRDRTAEVSSPALVLCGAEDEAIPPALVRGLADALPDVRYAEIAGAGHLPCLDRPDDVARHVAAFLDELGGR